jgi:hypothetical protein
MEPEQKGCEVVMTDCLVREINTVWPNNSNSVSIQNTLRLA